MGWLISASQFVLPLPQAAIIIASIYYVIAPLIGLYYHSADDAGQIKGSPASYFQLAVPCMFALAAGWSLFFYKLKCRPLREFARHLTESNTRQFDHLILAGMALAFIRMYVVLPTSLSFPMILLSNIRFIGVFGWVVLGAPGWKVRLFAVFFLELWISVSTGFFLDFCLWALNAGVLLISRYQISRTVILVAALSAVIMLPALQFAKWEIRRSAWGVDTEFQEIDVLGQRVKLTSLNKPFILVIKVIESSQLFFNGDEFDLFLATTVARYNQGWIVDRVLTHVPARESFAEGETIRDAMIATALPRFLFPTKMEAGGGKTFTRFTGIKLNAATSMNLGFVGEMYANFGYYGGILGCFVYGAVLAFVMRLIVQASQQRPLAIVFVPFVLNAAVISEVGIVEVANFTLKAGVFAVAMVLFLPSMFPRIAAPTSRKKRSGDDRTWGYRKSSSPT